MYSECPLLAQRCPLVLPFTSLPVHLTRHCVQGMGGGVRQSAILDGGQGMHTINAATDGRKTVCPY